MKLFRLTKILGLARVCLNATGLIFLTGCRGAPSINLLGSFFPAWMLCIALGVAGALAGCQVLTKAGIEPYLKARPLVYFCLWALITLTSWLLFFRS